MLLNFSIQGLLCCNGIDRHVKTEGINIEVVLMKQRLSSLMCIEEVNDGRSHRWDLLSSLVGSQRPVSCMLAGRAAPGAVARGRAALFCIGKRTLKIC